MVLVVKVRIKDCFLWRILVDAKEDTIQDYVLGVGIMDKSSINDCLKDFIEMSKYAGMREDLVQAGGGNSAYKISENRMVIKASGYQLADLTREEGYAIVDPQIITDAFLNNADTMDMTEEDAKIILKKAYIKGGRPSIETFLHAVSGRYTLHTHPVVVNALTCRKDGMKKLQTLFPQALMVPYATPGVELAKVYFVTYRNLAENVTVVFLQNHGLLVSGESSAEVMSTTEEVAARIETELKVDMAHYHAVTKLYGVIGKGIVWNVTDRNVLDLYKEMKGMWQHSFCPDCVVFLGRQILIADDDFDSAALHKFKVKYGNPVVISYKNNLYVCAESVKKALEIQSVLSFSAQVMRINEGQECNFLSSMEQDFLLHWDAEKYRKNLE